MFPLGGPLPCLLTARNPLVPRWSRLSLAVPDDRALPPGTAPHAAKSARNTLSPCWTGQSINLLREPMSNRNGRAARRSSRASSDLGSEESDSADQLRLQLHGSARTVSKRVELASPSGARPTDRWYARMAARV